MKICLVTPYSLQAISGVSRVVKDLCKGLKARNIEHLVVYGSVRKEIEIDEEINAIEIDATKVSFFRDVYVAVKTLIAIFKHRKSIDILHMQSPHLQAMCSAFMGRMMGIPVITTIHGKFPKPNNIMKRVKQKATIKGTIYFSNLITFVDNDSKKHYNVASGIVIENGIDTNSYSPDHQKRFKTRSKLGLTEEDVVLLYLGRLVAHKGIYDLLDAFSKVLTRVETRMKLVVIGGGEIDLVQKKIKDLKIESEVMLLGKVDDVVEYYRASDIFILYTSPLEGLPIALLEASACGLAIISTRVSGIPSVIKDGENGMLLEYGDKQGLVTIINELVEDETIRDNLKKNARKRIVKEYDIEKTVDSYIGLYETSVQKKRF